MQSTNPWKNVVPRLAGSGLLAGVAIAVGFARRDWEFLRPLDAAGAWSLVIAIATVVLALGTLGLATFALRGLHSLKLTRIEMINRAEREAKLLAIHRLEELASEVIPMNASILDDMATHKIDVFVKRSEEVRFDPDPPDLREAAQWAGALPHELHNKMLAFLNRLEAWSVYFTTGIADDSVAFGPVAPLLRSWVGMYYSVLLLERSQTRSGNFPNLVMLYEAWSNRMDAQQLETLHKDLITQLERHQSSMAKIRLPGVIGSKVDA